MTEKKTTLTVYRFNSDGIFMCLTIFIAIYIFIIALQFPEILMVLTSLSIPFDVSILLFLGPGILFSYLLYFPIGIYLERFWVRFLTNEGTRENETLSERKKRCKSYLMGFIYYNMSFCFAYCVALNSNYLPKVYGGNLELIDLQKSWPRKVDWSLQVLYMFSFGHHLERLIVHMICNYKTATYYTMFLHHLITVGLIAISMPTHYYHFGIPVLLLLDLSDAFLQISRFFREINFKMASRIAFVIMTFLWIQGRVYGFIKEVIIPVFWTLSEGNRSSFITEYLGLHYFFFMSLGLLAILNVFWLFQILKIFVTVFIKNKEKLEYEDQHMKKKNR